MTARPQGGWKTGADRSVRVAYGPGYFEGTLARVDDRYGLGLIRVQEDGIAASLWQQRRPVQVRAGERVALVGRDRSTTAEIVRIGDRRITLAPPADRSLTGGPVLDGAGQVVGVVASDGAAIPIGRACRVIRRC